MVQGRGRPRRDGLTRLPSVPHHHDQAVGIHEQVAPVARHQQDRGLIENGVFYVVEIGAKHGGIAATQQQREQQPRHHAEIAVPRQNLPQHAQ